MWAYLDEAIEEEIDLNLDGNPMLEPSPALNLKAVVTKVAEGDDAGKTQVALSFDNIWYTTEVRNHEWRYKAGDGDFSEWAASDPATGCDPPCDKLDDDARVRITIPSTLLRMPTPTSTRCGRSRRSPMIWVTLMRPTT